MALEQRLNLKQTQQLRMTPQLRQAIKILQVARGDLEAMVAEEVEQNPVLEEKSGEGEAREPESRTGDIETAEAEATETDNGDRQSNAEDLRNVDWAEYVDRYSGRDFHGSIGGGSDRDDNRMAFIENTAGDGGGLTEALLDQLGLIMMSEEERRVGTVIIHNLDENGHLACPPAELAFMADCSEDTVNEVREIIQEFEPPGTACLDLRESLLVQLRLKGYEPDDYVVMLVDNRLGDLERARYDRIAKDLGTTVEEIVECHGIIKNLEPRPGANLGTPDTRYIVPDVYIHRVGDEFQVTLNDEGLPALQLSPYYRRLLDENGSTKEARGFLRDKWRSATWLIRSIEQRQQTLRKVAESIVQQQWEFLSKGVEYLRPMVLKDVALDINMHESTVSRATSNKYAHTPQGLVELKYFFTSSLKGTDGTEISSESVKQKILKIVREEDPGKPYSDQYIASQLREQCIDIARRTVAKYRELLGILPSSKRKKHAAAP